MDKTIEKELIIEKIKDIDKIVEVPVATGKVYSEEDLLDAPSEQRAQVEKDVEHEQSKRCDMMTKICEKMLHYETKMTTYHRDKTDLLDQLKIKDIA